MQFALRLLLNLGYMVKWRWLTSKGRSGMTEVVQMVKFCLIPIVRKQLYLNSAGVTRLFQASLYLLLENQKSEGGKNKLTKKR